jgi:hypothetical protein
VRKFDRMRGNRRFAGRTDFTHPTGWKNFASDPEVPSIMQQAGHKNRPQVTELVGRFDA